MPLTPEARVGSPTSSGWEAAQTADRARAGTSEFILRRHDPAVLRCPAPRPGAVAADRMAAALTWNVFGTLAAITPAFWWRRLHARMFGAPDAGGAPVIARVATWEPLPPLGPGAPDAGVSADVLIETEHAVLGFRTIFGGDLPLDRRDDTAADPLLVLMDRLSIRAGVRDAYGGVIVADPAAAPWAVALADRYALPDVLRRRLPASRINVRGVGRATWADLGGILRDCAAADTLDDLERYTAARTVGWLERAGISQPLSRTPSSSARG